MTRATFDLIKEKYGFYSSWAIWADAGGKPKSNIGDLRVFDMDANPSVLGELKPHIVFVGLNISRGLIHEPLANFHDPRLHQIRFARAIYAHFAETHFVAANPSIQ
jgi:hypothetical protein